MKQDNSIEIYKILSKINFDSLINSGPFAVESKFNQLGRLVYINTTPFDNENQTQQMERYMGYVDLLSGIQSSNKESLHTSFLNGYFNQQAAVHCPVEKERENFFKRALSGYQTFLRLNRRFHSDAGYFAQWQIGALQQYLEYPWPTVEGSYLKAIEYNSVRAEAIRDILLFYSSHNEWRISYIYSLYCKNQFLGKPPSKEKWYINIPFYNWKILKYHISTLINLKKKEDANKCLLQLASYFNLHHSTMSSEEKSEISSLKNYFEKMLR